MADTIASGPVPVVCLTEDFRRAPRTRFVGSAHWINGDATPELSRPEGDSNFYFDQEKDLEMAA